EVPGLDEVHAVYDVVAHLLVAVSHDHEVRSRCRERDAREPERRVFGAHARRVVGRRLIETAMDQHDFEIDAGEIQPAHGGGCSLRDRPHQIRPPTWLRSQTITPGVVKPVIPIFTPPRVTTTWGGYKIGRASCRERVLP